MLRSPQSILNATGTSDTEGRADVNNARDCPWRENKQQLFACAGSSYPAAERGPSQFMRFMCVYVRYPKYSAWCSAAIASLSVSRSCMAAYGLFFILK